MSIVVQADRTAWFQSAKNVTLTAAQNTFLDIIQPWVERVCWHVLGFSPEQATFTEFYPTAGSERPPLNFGIDIGWDLIGGVAMPRSRTDLYEGAITLRALPVRSVTSVYENLAAWTGGDTNGTWPVASLLPATAYRLDMESADLCRTGRLYRTVGGWPSAPRTVKVTYVAGYTQVEIDATYPMLKMAVLQGIAWWWGRAMRASNSTKTLGLIAMQMGIRDFNVTLGDPNQMSAQPGAWAWQMLGPDSMNILVGFVNLAAKYLIQ